MFRDPSIPIVIAFTPNYFVPATTFVLSLLKHSNIDDCYHLICLLTDELPFNMQNDIKDIGGDRVRVTYINLSGYLVDIYINERYTVAASFRLILPDILPSYDKVLYMDCDLIIRTNVADLFRSTDLTGYYLGAVYEPTLDFQKQHIESIGCVLDGYINSGVLLMNLQLLRQDKMVRKFLKAAQVENLEFPDQDILNQVCRERILALPPHYNGIRTFFLPQYKKEFLRRYTEQEWLAVQKYGNIHYTGAKPWNTFTVAFDVWWKYYRLLPKSIQKYQRITRKMAILEKMYANRMGKIFIDGVRVGYRMIK